MAPGLSRPIRITAIVVILGAITAFALATKRLSKEPLTGKPAPAASVAPVAVRKFPYKFTRNAECKACHEEIWKEFEQDQHALAWFNQPLLQPDPKKTECNNCHAPQPILEIGYEKLPEIRTSRFEEGVGCIECHQNVDHVEGPLATSEAPCNPVHNPAFTTSNICNSCHAPHGSYDEWKDSEWARKGFTCQACHMPLVERPSATGGPVRKVRSHRMRTQRDPSMLKESVTLEARIEGRRVIVSLANTGTGHNVPGEINNREMFVITAVTDAAGEQVASHRESLRTITRQKRSSEQSTQLKPGEKRTWTYDLPEGKGRVKVQVNYAFLYLFPAMAELVHEQTLDY